MIVVDQPIVDADHFSRFIKCCLILEKLCIETAVEQAIYDRFHEWCSKLTSLTINDPELINLDFVFNLKNLLSFTTNQEIQPNQLAKFKTLANLQELDFKFNDKDAEIRNQYFNCRMIIDNNLAIFDKKDDVFNFLKLFVD